MKTKPYAGLAQAQFLGILISILLMAVTSFSTWTLASLGFTVVIMLASMAMQARARIEELRESDRALPGRSGESSGTSRSARAVCHS